MSGPVDGIVLAGTYHWSGVGFESLRPRPLLPVAQAPLITYGLRWMAAGGVPRAFVCLNEDTRRVRDCLRDGSHLGLAVDYYEDASPRGAAGCARDVAARSEAERFLIADGTAVPTVDRDHLLASHEASGAALTVVVHRDDHAEAPSPSLSPAGVYVAERSVFDFVPAAGFHDIKENLIPRLHRSGLRVRTHLAAGCCPRVVDSRTYLTVSHWMISRLVHEHGAADGWGAVFAGHDEVLAHPTAWVDPEAKLLGPILLGPGVKVKAAATIVGPTSIGAEGTIGEGAVVSRSVTWERCVVNPQAFLDSCVLVDDAQVVANAELCGLVVTAAVPGPARAPVCSNDAPQASPLPWTLRQPATPPR